MVLFGKGHLLAILAVAMSLTTVLTIHAQDESLIPAWIKNSVSFWIKGDVSDKEFISAIEWMVENRVIKVDTMDAESKKHYKELTTKVTKLEEENRNLLKNSQKLRAKIIGLQDENKWLKEQLNTADNSPSNQDPEPPRAQSNQYSEAEPSPEDFCLGYAECFVGHVTQIIDGDTIDVDGKSIRFALVNTPEYGQSGYTQATNYIKKICPVGSTILVDEDDGQTQGSYGRMIALVYCQDIPTSLNEAILEVGLAKIDTRFCSQSEFADQPWAYRNGCGTSQEEYSQPSQPKPQPQQSSCDPSYPDVCIPSPPPDLDCGEISHRNFRVVGSDPHRFDGDKDGVGCEG